jgi:uncharacterized Rossmann fold enzyme
MFFLSFHSRFSQNLRTNNLKKKKKEKRKKLVCNREIIGKVIFVYRLVSQNLTGKYQQLADE